MLTEQQRAARLGLITSSNVAACLGLSDKYSPLAGYCWVTGEPYVTTAQRLTGAEVNGVVDLVEPDKGNRYTERGTDLEPVTLAWAGRVLGCEVEPAPFVAHPNGMFGDSTDALLTSKASGEVYAAEAKTVSPREADDWGREMTAEIPPGHRVQAQWHLVHRPLEICYVPFLGGYDFGYRLYCVERDAEWQRELVELATEFWHRHIKPRVPPRPTARDTDYLKAKYPWGEKDKLYQVTEELSDAVAEALKWRGRRDLAVDNYDAACNVVRDLLKDHDAAVSPLFKVSYRNSKDVRSIDWQAIALAKGATELEIHQHTSHRPGPRTLRITGRGDWKVYKR